MESAEYKKQYDEYLARAEKALSQACERYLPDPPALSPMFSGDGKR